MSITRTLKFFSVAELKQTKQNLNFVFHKSSKIFQERDINYNHNSRTQTTIEILKIIKKIQTFAFRVGHIKGFINKKTQIFYICVYKMETLNKNKHLPTKKSGTY